jgi:hypothetical protein
LGNIVENMKVSAIMGQMLSRRALTIIVSKEAFQIAMIAKSTSNNWR